MKLKSIKGAEDAPPPPIIDLEDPMLGIFCLRGVLDGVRHNTRFNWGRCR